MEETRKCLRCGAEFKPNTRWHRYCGLECWKAAGGKEMSDVPEERKCARCGAAFKPSHKMHWYCSVECHSAAGDDTMRMLLDPMLRREPAPTKQQILDAAIEASYPIAMAEAFWEDFVSEHPQHREN